MQKWAPDLYFSFDPTSAEYDEECADFGWTWNDLEMGLIERLNADVIGDLWDGPTINSGPLDGEPEPADPHGVSASEVVLTWSRTTLWPVLSWSAPPKESYDALDRLLGYLIAGPEWLPP